MSRFYDESFLQKFPVLCAKTIKIDENGKHTATECIKDEGCGDNEYVSNPDAVAEKRAGSICHPITECDSGYYIEKKDCIFHYYFGFVQILDYLYH